MTGPLPGSQPLYGIPGIGGGAAFSIVPGGTSSMPGAPCVFTITDNAGSSFQIVVNNSVTAGGSLKIPG